MRARILALFLVLSVVPTTMELVEVVVHFAEHGDLAHATNDGHEKSGLGTDEHGCTGTFHLCGCHTASLLAPTIAIDLNVFSSLEREARTECASRDGVGAIAPPIRPPIA